MNQIKYNFNWKLDWNENIVSIIIGFIVHKKGGKFFVFAPEANSLNKMNFKLWINEKMGKSKEKAKNFFEQRTPLPLCSNYFWPNFAAKLWKLSENSWFSFLFMKFPNGKLKETKTEKKKKERKRKSRGRISLWQWFCYLFNHWKIYCHSMLKIQNSKNSQTLYYYY